MPNGKPRSIRSYLRLWWDEAFKPTLHAIDFWSGIVGGVALPIAAHFNKWIAGMVNAWQFQILLGLVAALVLARIVLAPYRIWKSQQAKIDRLQGENDGLTARLSPTIEILFDPTSREFVHETFETNYPDKKRQYISVLPMALTDAHIEGCRGWLTGVWKRTKGETEWRLTSFTERRALEWGTVGNGAVSLSKATKQPLNVGFTRSKDGVLHPATQSILNKDQGTFSDRDSEYKFEIVVVPANAASAKITLLFSYGNSWNDFKVERLA